MWLLDFRPGASGNIEKEAGIWHGRANNGLPVPYTKVSSTDKGVLEVHSWDLSDSWVCPKCKKLNYIDLSDVSDNEDEKYSCRHCRNQVYLDFDIQFSVSSVIDAEEEDERRKQEAEREKKERWERQHPEVLVSCDGGKRWLKMRIDSTDFDPKTQVLQPGWLVKNKGYTYRVILDKDGLLSTEHVAG